MMHKPYSDWMQLALDGELAQEHRTRLEAHLAECVECAGWWEALNRVEAFFTDPPLARPRAGFTGRFNARLQQQHSQPKTLWGLITLGVGAFSSGALVAGFVLFSLVWPVVHLVGQPAASAALWQSAGAASEVLLTLVDALWVVIRALGEWALQTPLAWLCVVIALGLTLAWVFTIRRFALQGLRL